MSGLKGFLNIIGLATKDGETPPGDATKGIKGHFGIIHGMNNIFGTSLITMMIPRLHFYVFGEVYL